ncbi:hypothetical protein F5B20DRAFT_588377 [Whalleya microplaca]|nr:hypothetical protein F5B20DRAFT_588377 [Whalleya microplaca]
MPEPQDTSGAKDSTLSSLMGQMTVEDDIPSENMNDTQNRNFDEANELSHRGFDGSNEDQNIQQLFEIKRCEKGLGIFAVRGIRRGTRLFSEPPLLLFSQGEDEDLDWGEYIKKKFDQLRQEEQEVYLSLAYHLDLVTEEIVQTINNRIAESARYDSKESRELAVEEQIRLVAIYDTNNACVSSVNQPPTDFGIFPIFSKANHSCTPNAYWSYNPEARRMTVHAIRDLAPGEEILVSYCDLLQPAWGRAQEFQRYCFQCTCEACEGELKAVHDERRQRLSDIDAILQAYKMREGYRKLKPSLLSSVPGDDKKAAILSDEAVLLTKEEGLVGLELTMAQALYITAYVVNTLKLPNMIIWLSRMREPV